MVVVARCIALVIAGLIALFLSWFGPKSKSWVSEWAFPLLGVLGLFAEMAGAIALVRYAVPILYARYDSDWGVQIAVAVAACLLLYLVALSTQFIENAVRLIRGQKPNRIEWFKNQRRRKPRRKPTP